MQYSPDSEFWSGYPGETAEGLQHLQAVAVEMPYSLGDVASAIPDRVDVRLDTKFAKSWMRTENQGGVGACFPAGTLVSIAGGGHRRPIEAVKTGDYVVSHEGLARRVTEVMNRRYDGEMLTVSPVGWKPVTMTADHVVLVKRGDAELWVRADEVDTETDLLLVGGGISPKSNEPEDFVSEEIRGQWRRILEISSEEVEDVTVYDFTVEVDHSFFAGGLAVHNCQGYGLIETVEYLYAVLTGQIAQLAPMFAYLRSQYYDGISGDRGSTLSGGTKVLEKDGLPPLSAYPVERQYPRNGYRDIPQSVLDTARKGPFRTLKVVPFRSAESIKAFIGSHAGIIQTGTAWTEGLANVGGHGVVQSIGGRNYGGHSWNLCGYAPNDALGAEARRYLPRSKYNWHIIGHNSHGERYGDGGFMYFVPELVDQLGGRGDLLLGRTDMGEIKPRPSKRDFTDPKNSFFAS